jgi:hypothetical protein
MTEKEDFELKFQRPYFLLELYIPIKDVYVEEKRASP